MFRLIAVGCLGVLLIGNAARSADPGRVPGTAATTQRIAPETAAQAEARRASRKLDIAKGDVSTPGTAVKRLTVDDINTMLQNFGYETTPGQYNDGSKYVSVKIPRGDWTFSFTFDLSSDQSNIWLSAWLGTVKDPSMVRADRLLPLLEAEGNVWPGYFAYHSDSKDVYFYRPIVNSNLTPVTMRQTLDGAMDSMQSTGDLWNLDNW
ncbi:MAG TPA: hypothetical protein VG713_10630, partial [Pirellulales bacterium]|nr:hypothetical protein [Pirellulales bacterium]